MVPNAVLKLARKSASVATGTAAPESTAPAPVGPNESGGGGGGGAAIVGAGSVGDSVVVVVAVVAVEVPLGEAPVSSALAEPEGGVGARGGRCRAASHGEGVNVNVTDGVVRGVPTLVRSAPSGEPTAA